MALPVTQSIQIKANGTDVSSSIDWNSIDMVLVLTKETSTFKFNVVNPGATVANHGSPYTKYNPGAGDVIEYYETTNDGSGNVVNKVFGGTITEIETVVQEGILLVAQVTCTDWGYTMNGKLVVKSYGAMDPADIVADIVSNYCPAGFNASTYVQRAGFNIPSIKFNYEQPTKCIQALASQIGWDWNVDADKNIHFFLAENNPAPFVIDDTSGAIDWSTLDVDVNLQNMKNSVFVIGGVYESVITAGATSDMYLGNGTQVAFSLRYAYTPSTITVTLNGVVQSIGVANQVTDPSAYQTLYDQGNQVITFNTVPSVGAVVKVYGTAEIPIIGHAIDQPAVNVFGEFQDAIFDSQIKSIAEAQQRALADILLYGHSVFDVKFYTMTPRLRVGQNILLNSAKFGISNYPLVVKRIEGQGFSPHKLRYYVECIGSDVPTFVDIMSTLLQKENANTTIDNTTLEVLLNIYESLASSDSVSAPTALPTENYTYTSGSQIGVWNFATWA